MNHFQFVSQNEQDTKNFARSLASILQKKDVLILTGDLGSGKTKFTEGILSYFGLQNEISSPTFTIVNEYQKNDISIYHFDVYRLENSSEFCDIGGEEYLENGICIIEWGELILDILPENYLHITFSKDTNNDTIRKLSIDTNSKKWEDYFETIKY
ncbi:MAG: tRNA (adenosine(37)-N6)-threonylcarbamoyltransferase complex ATPase subunit type 1 TsaE [Clostridia bacterium]|nr:tRNA (adenosine(37)-N6)-threonylcarbamoyltransferase complex ATPase subunit type 1 TsaE [Clostridia bacterium]